MSELQQTSAVDIVVMDEAASLSLGDLCRLAHLHAEAVITLVEEGVIEPQGVEPGQWRFPAETVCRIHRLQRLQHDLDLNLPGAALALDLLEEVRLLRARVRALESMLDRW